MSIKDYELSDLNEISVTFLEEQKRDGHIELFNSCYGYDDVFCIYKKSSIGKNIVAFIKCEHENGKLEIDEFEVIERFRDKGIGTAIISDIQNCENIKMIELYAKDDGANKFWKKCGFQEYDDGTGTPIMVWEK